MAVVAYLAGIFVLVSVLADWNRFFAHPRARFFVDILGRGGARLFYAVLGSGLLFLGFCLQKP